MRILHITASLSRLGAGVSQAVLALARHQAALGADVRVFGLADRFTEADRTGSPPGEMLSACRVVGPSLFGYSPELRRALRVEAGKADIVHSHGLWMYHGVAARRFAHEAGAKLVIAPHNMLTPWSLARSAWKKRIALALFEQRNLDAAACFHALSEFEAEHMGIASAGNRPVAVIANGVDLAEFANVREKACRFLERFPSASGRRIALFLGRIHPVKGLPHLMKAWATTRKEHSDWLLAVVGPDQDGYRAEVEGMVAELGIGESVLFTGALYGEDRLAALGAADIFILPSLTEGLSMALLEALASGLPSVVTSTCHLPQVAEYRAGLVCEPDAGGVGGALVRMMGQGAVELAAMGENGRRLVEERYSWDRIAARALDLYEWLLHGGGVPQCLTVARDK